MGFLMSACLVKNGYSVTGYDIVPTCMERAEQVGVRRAASAGAAAEGADVVICMMRQPSETRQALFGAEGMAPVLKEGVILVDMSTSSPADTREMGAELAKKGVIYLDAPVSGGVGKARTGTLSIMASGDREAYEKVLPVLKAMGEEVFYVGEIGTGKPSS